MKKHLQKYIRAVLFSFGLCITAITVFVMLLGDTVKDGTAITALGSQGIPAAVVIQFLLANMAVTAVRGLFISDAVFKNMKPALRLILALLSMFLTVLGFILVCGWFPLNPLVLAVFAVSFLIPAFSVAGMLRRERDENERLAAALQQYKSGHSA